VAGTDCGNPAATHAAGALDERAQRVSEQVGGVPASERALAAPDRRADGVDDDGLTGR
jgi:hypothetical protein